MTKVIIISFRNFLSLRSSGSWRNHVWSSKRVKTRNYRKICPATLLKRQPASNLTSSSSSFNKFSEIKAAQRCRKNILDISARNIKINPHCFMTKERAVIWNIFSRAYNLRRPDTACKNEFRFFKMSSSMSAVRIFIFSLNPSPCLSRLISFYNFDDLG